MSDYMFMLDSHLNADQGKALTRVRDAAEQENLNLFLTGGAMRDMMGGFPLRDLDFTVEGAAVKFAKTLSENAAAEIVSVDDLRKSVELEFPGKVRVSISMARQERYLKPGGKPQVQAANIHDDLRCRDFTINAVALSLGKASRGLLLDPANGLGDLSHKELRTVSNHSLYDDPSRLLRMVRLRTRFGFTVDERTLSQYRNVREAELESKISAAALQHELREIALEQNSGEILKALEEEKLLHLFSPALVGPKLNLAGFQKLQKARRALPFDLDAEVNWLSVFLFVLFEKLSPKERAQLVANVELQKSDVDSATRLESRAAKVEKEIATSKTLKPSGLYAILSKAPGELIVFILMRSNQRLVQERLKNYLQKYLPTAQEVTDKEVMERGVQPGTPKFLKLQQEMIAKRLDARPKKVVVEEPPPLPPPGPGRRSATFGR